MTESNSRRATFGTSGTFSYDSFCIKLLQYVLTREPQLRRFFAVGGLVEHVGDVFDAAVELFLQTDHGIEGIVECADLDGFADVDAVIAKVFCAE